MNSQTEELKAIRRYLLGQLPPAELPQLEERLLNDGEFYEELLIVEDELVDDYLTGELSASERVEFERFFLSTPERIHKVRFGRALKKYVTVSPALESSGIIDGPDSEFADRFARKPKRSWWPFFRLDPVLAYSLAAIVTLAAIGISWWVIKGRFAATPQGTVFAVALNPGGTRDDQATPQRFAIPPGTGTVRLRLQLMKNEYQSYAAVLNDLNGVVILRRDNLKIEADNGPPAVVVDIASGSLPPDDYLLKLSGITADGSSEGVGSYYFRLSGW